ncbi:MAG: hypothetical protein FWC12_10725 [Treponema sp.]|nr:hypothetical protein [Treponema sp.]
MNDNVELLIAIIASTTAAIVSVINILITKKKITSDTFPKFRSERIYIIKESINNFIDVCFVEPGNRIKKEQALFKVELNLNYIDSTAYNNLRKELYKYLESDDLIKDHEQLIKETHRLFNWMIAKAKLEAGITPKIEEKYLKILRKHFNKCEGCDYYCERRNMCS